MDLQIIAAVFVVVVVGGMGSILGAYLAALLISLIRVLLITNAQLTFGGIAAWQMELVSMFLVMALVLVARPWGLLGRREALGDQRSGTPEPMLSPADPALRRAGLLLLLFLLALPWLVGPYFLSLATEALILVLFAASLQFLMGVGGIISFGHAAYFGLGAYGVGLLVRHWGAPMELALLGAPLLAALGALLFGWFCVRLSGVYLAMLTLAFAQIAWSIAFQWIDLTGGDNGIVGIWPPAWAASTSAFYYLAGAICVIGVLCLRHLAFSPFGYTLRAGRDSPLRADAIGIDVRQHRWLAFTVAGIFAGVAGGLFAYLKGSVSPGTMSIAQSIDGLVMVLLGGVQTLIGPILGGAVYSILKSELISLTNYWRSLLGIVIILLVVLFPQGLAGGAAMLRARVTRRA